MPSRTNPLKINKLQLRTLVLRQVLADWAPAPALVHLVHQKGRLVPPKIRAFMDFAAPRLTATLGDLSALAD